MTPHQNISQFLAEKSQTAGRLTDQMSYIMSDDDNTHLIIIGNGKPERGPDVYVASREACNEMLKTGISIEDAVTSEFFNNIIDIGEEVKPGEVKSLSRNTSERNEDEGNSVQTKKEAEIAADTKLIASIQEMYKDKLHPPPLEKINNLLKIGDTPIIYQSYSWIKHVGLLDSTITYLDDCIIFRSPGDIEVKKEQSFVYEKIEKSSKMSFGMGLGMLLPPPPGIPYSIGGPKKGEPVFEDKKPKKDSAGNAINFNFEWTKKWRKLRIEAELKVQAKISGWVIRRIPRKLG